MKCRLPLNICSAVGVHTRGLGGWIYITCDNQSCTTMNKIFIGKQHKKHVKPAENPFNQTSPGSAISDVNTKAASEILHSGIGESDLNSLLSVLNLPQISHKSLKVREVEIGSIIETFANTFVDDALQKEQELTELNTGNVGIEVSSDAAWQKKGSQQSYNSLSGIASTTRKRTKKIVHYNARFKRCQICWYASKHRQPAQKHKCQLNWHGSAMEKQWSQICLLKW